MPNRIDAPSSGTMIWYALYVVSRPYYQPLSAYQADMGILYCCLERRADGTFYLSVRGGYGKHVVADLRSEKSCCQMSYIIMATMKI